MFKSLWPRGLQHPQLPCPSPAPRVCSNSCPLSLWCHPTISSSVVPFSSCPPSCPASGSFPTSQIFTSGGQSIGASASASVLPMNTQDWFPLGLTDLISCDPRNSQESFQHHSSQASILWHFSPFSFLPLIYHPSPSPSPHSLPPSLSHYDYPTFSHYGPASLILHSLWHSPLCLPHKI